MDMFCLFQLGKYQPAEDIFSFTVTDNLALPLAEIRSECPGVCMECLYLFRYQKFMYIPGDILIPGIFDVHYRGDSPYTCSNFRAVNGFQYTEAFRFALDRVNSGSSVVKLNGVTLGGIGFDGCTDPIRASALVTGIYSGAFPRPDSGFGGVQFETQDLAGWLSYDSDSTVSVARYLQRFTVPSLSPGATTPLLDDKSKFTTFFRTIPSDSVVAEGMAKLSQKLGFDYIITLNDPDAGSRDSVRVFREYAQALGICIGASYEFETDGDAEQILQYILQSTTRVVAVFASPDRYIPNLLIQKQNNPLASNLIFIANNAWTTAVKDVAVNSPENTIMFYRNEFDKLTSFRYHLASQRPILEHPNPWIREFYEDLKECSLPGSQDYNSNTACRIPYDISEGKVYKCGRAQLLTVFALNTRHFSPLIHLRPSQGCWGTGEQGQLFQGNKMSKNEGNRGAKAILENREHRKLRFENKRKCQFISGEQGNRYTPPPPLPHLPLPGGLILSLNFEQVHFRTSCHV